MSRQCLAVDALFRLVYSLHHRSCHAKCISTRYAEGDLNKGESVCIDRCVAKFFEVNKKVGEKLTDSYLDEGMRAHLGTLHAVTSYL